MDEAGVRDDKRFPVLSTRNGECRFTWIPWSAIEAHRKQAEGNHGQTLEVLARRGGLDPAELFLALSDRKLFESPLIGTESEERWRKLTRQGVERIAQLRGVEATRSSNDT